MATMFYGNDTLSTCSATIISRSFILTAAHCLFYFYSTHGQGFGPWTPMETRELTIAVGTVDYSTETARRQRVQSLRIIPHPNYTWNFAVSKGFDDIALIELSIPLQFSKTVQQISLSGSFIKSGSFATIAGWGLFRRSIYNSSTTLLHKGSVRIVSGKSCKRKMPAFLESKALCTTGTPSDSCNGDSGGPLLLVKKGGGYLQVGVAIATLGSFCSSPDVFTRISEKCPWLSDATKQNVTC